MRIKEIHIDRFGRFINHTLKMPRSSFIVIQGPNEAGKSTLMTFITNMLFGFPTRNKRLSYSKQAEHYHLGGQMTIELGNKENVTIQRVSTEKAPIAYSNGFIESNQELIKLITRGLDRSLYEAIFCFDLSGLNGLEDMSDDDLNHYLFSTGMMGSSRIQRLEKQLDNNQSHLFKPSGKNPLVNKLLSELESDTNQAQSWIRKNETYIKLKDQEQHIELSLLDNYEKTTELEFKKERLKKYSNLKPLILEHERIHKKVESLSDADRFPEDGLIRMENYKQQELEIIGELEEAQMSINRITQEAKAIDLNLTLLDRTKDIEILLNEVPKIDHLNKELIAVKETVQHIDDQLHDAFAQLGDGWSETQLDATDTGLVAKEELHKLLKAHDQLVQDKRHIELSLGEVNEKLTHYRDKVEQEKAKQLTVNERHRLEEQLSFSKQRESIQRELDSLKDRQRHKEQQMKEFAKLGNTLSVSGLLISLVMILISLIGNQLIIGLSISAVLIGATVFMRYYLIKLSKKGTSQFENNLFQLNQKLSEFDDVKVDEVEEQLSEDDKVSMVLDMLLKQIEEEEITYQDYNRKLNHYETEEISIKQQVEEWCHHIGLPKNTSYHMLVDLFGLLSASKQKRRDQLRYLQKIAGISKELADYHYRYETLLKDIALMPSMSQTDLKHTLLLEKDKANKNEQLQHELVKKQEHVKSLTKKMSHVKSHIQSLFEQAGVETEDDFRKKAKMKQDLISLQKSLDNLSYQIDVLVHSKEERDTYRQLIINGDWEQLDLEVIKSEINDLHEEEKRHRQHLSDIKSEMKGLEESNGQSNLIHEMETKRSIFAHYSKQWAVYRIAQELLRMAKEEYRQDRLPKLLQTSSEYFNKITNGKYIKIKVVEEQGFTVTSYDGQVFDVIELSRGTKEQLYLSIRLALATLFDSEIAYPLIIDDSFVNFDKDRLSSVMELLIDISNERQVILFTCHKDPYTNDYQHIPTISLDINVEEAMYD